MPEDTAPTPAQPHLSPSQRSRLEFARRDLDDAHVADLAALPPSSLIFLVERLRGRLDDMLTLTEETHE